jgi:ActR/RegA family two-component response regulator
MASDVNAPRVLAVDDDLGILTMLRSILEHHGYQTQTVATVSDALSCIVSTKFDVLISDLNIGQPGDGFTVVSAMHRVDPSCRTIILTGFPAFESALQAIRSQVDDYIVKPADIPALIETIRNLLHSPAKKLPIEGKRLSAILRDHSQEIIGKTLQYMKADSQLGEVPIGDAERVEHVPEQIEQLIALLESDHPERVPEEAFQMARNRGKLRRSQGYTCDMLASEARVFLTSLNEVVEENLLEVNMSHLVTESKWLRESVLQQLSESMRGLHDA